MDEQPNEPAPPPPRRKRRWWLVAVLLASPLVLLLAAQIAGWWFLTRRFDEIVNRNPQRLVVTHEALAWDVLRGVRVRNLTLRGQTHSVQWEVRVAEARCRLVAHALIDKTLHFDGIDARGVTVRLRAFPDEAEAGSPDAPPIEGFADPPVLAADRPPKRSPPAKRWTYVFTDCVARDVSEIWIGPWRFEGSGVAGVGDVRVRVREVLHVDGASFVSQAGRLAKGGTVVADGIDTTTTFSILDHDPRRHRPREILRHSSGRTAGTVSLRELALPGVHFPHLPWLGFGGARGKLAMDVALDRGVVQPGSRFTLDAEDLAVVGLAWQVNAVAAVEGRVDRDATGPMGRVDARLARYSLKRPAADGPLLEGEKLDLTVESRDLDLLDPLVTHLVHVDVPPARLLDLGELNGMIPAGVPLSVHGGSGTLSARLRADEAVADGDLDLQVDDLDLRFETVRLRGRLDLDGALPSVDPRAMRFDFSGTKVALTDFVLGDGVEARDRGWWGRLEVPRGVVNADAGVRFDGTVHAELADMRPVIAIIDAARGLPALAKPLLKADDVTADFGLRTAPDALLLRDLVVTAKGLEIRACVAREPARQRGFLWLDSGLVRAGVRFGAEGRHVKLFAGETWLAERAGDCD